MQKLQVHSEVYINGKLLNLEKALERQVFLLYSPQKRAENEMTWNKMENVATSKCDNKETVEAYTGRTDQRGKDATSSGPTKQNHAILAALT